MSQRRVQSPSSGPLRTSIGSALRLRYAAMLAVPLLLLAARGNIVAPPAEPVVVSDVGALAADVQLDAAASVIESRLATGGSGFSFTVVARSTLYTQPGGPKIEVPDPIDRFKTLGLVDEYYLSGVIASGVALPNGFFLQMRDGPATPEAVPDFVNAQTTLAALVRDGVTWRNDGDGWYQTDMPPGIGLDPVTVALLPRLLRAATGPALAGAGIVGGDVTTKITATGKVADAPGLMAVDAASFTVLTEPITFSLDDAGRLREVRVLSRNTRMTEFDLLVETVITFDYPATPPALPEPKPIWTAPAAAPQG